ncbi:MAG TPA: response regulator [Ktedonobacterales bacterium]|nr:response regulator [Ktedonobacterales bacterium]
MNQRVFGRAPHSGQSLRGRQPQHLGPRAGYILLIDDSAAILSLLTTLLGEMEGYAVRAAQSVREAQRVAAVEAPAPILLDLRLPGETTAESMRRLRRRDDWAAAPLVLSSGHQQIAAFARELHADAYLPKPFDLDAVSAFARRYVIPQGDGIPIVGAPLQRYEPQTRTISVELLAFGVDGWDDIVPGGM